MLVALFRRVRQQVAKAVVGQEQVLEGLVAAVAVGGHVLLEGPPGVAKTLLARAFAASCALDMRRIQFTPDLLPSDVTGTLTLRAGELVFRKGPVFANVVLADEINRTPPKTQAALLEAMQEGRVSVEGESHELPSPFLLMATQNPIEYEGTYPLPEAQLDRFLMKLHVRYPQEVEETAMLGLRRSGTATATLADVEQVVSAEELLEARSVVDGTRVASEILPFVSGIVRRTRELPAVELGASPRAGVHLLAVAKATARLAGRDYVTPEDVTDNAVAVLAHRLVLKPEADLDRYDPAEAVAAAVAAQPVPR